MTVHTGISSTTQLHALPLQQVARAGARLQAIDLLRGMVVVLMALDHVRDFFHVQAFLFNPLDVGKTDAALYLTRWLTNFCAPAFVFLAGTSAFLYGARINDKAALARFLLTRGLWLIALELTLVNFAWNFSFPDPGLQVIWAIGASMMMLSLLIWLPSPAVLAIGLIIVAGHNMFDGIRPETLGDMGPWWRLLHVSGPFHAGGLNAWVVYPLIPWTGVMAAGYGAGMLFLATPDRRYRICVAAGMLMMVAFFLLRTTQWYGEPRAWSSQAHWLATAGDFMNVRKYPPSLLYLLITLGPALLILPWLERWRGRMADMLLVFGRVPMFFYLAHLYLAHGLMLATGLASGYPAEVFIGPMSNPGPLIASGWGFSLPGVYIAWLIVLMLLYPLCRWFGNLKQRRKDWWLSYL
jgi:uncharacterized membrane protein